MGRAYTPGLEVREQTVVTKLRELPLAGEALVAEGAVVSSDTPVLRADLPGELIIVRVADMIGLDPEDVASAVQLKAGDLIHEGDVICSIRTFFGLFRSTVTSPATGKVEFFTAANAHLGIRLAPIPLVINAYLAGTVVAVEPTRAVTIRSEAALIQGIFGVGGERHGSIVALPSSVNKQITVADLSALDIKGKVLVGGRCFEQGALQEAARREAAAVVTGSIDAATLRAYVGFDIGVSITGDEDVPFTLIVTEGFGDIPMSERILSLAAKFEGRLASVNGATQVRAGALRPEIVIPSSSSAPAAFHKESSLSDELSVGSRVRIIRVPYFGEIGTVTELPHLPARITTGADVRVLKAKLVNGNEVLIPRANVELL